MKLINSSKAAHELFEKLLKIIKFLIEIKLLLKSLCRAAAS